MAYIAECKALQVHQGPPLDAPVKMEVLACPPDRRRRDLDNLSKSLCDVAVHLGLLEDDHWIHDLHMKWDRENVANGVLLYVTLLDVEPVTVKP
jgi:crossover junction endodeoxyribonuclease RusA|tara:strand:+ start:169 stop:450 length:282 start_codon:yes stop_codon:yes gene_type:complete